MLFYEESEKGGQFRETVADIRAGKGNYRIPARNPVLVYLFSPSGKIPSAIFYASKGDKITVSGETTDIAKWDITGNETTDQLTRWRLDNQGAAGMREGDKLDDSIAKFVDKNPDSRAAAILLYVYFNRRDKEAQFLKLQSKLGKTVIDDKDLMRALSASDLITGLPDRNTVPSVIIKTGESGYADTLRLAKEKKTALLIFRDGSSTPETAIAADSIKSLIKNNKGKIVAEFFVESDSLSWRRHLRGDTIEGLKRFWLPVGLADSTAIAMRITRLPFFLVVDSASRQIYRGQDWKEAVKKFK